MCRTSTTGVRTCVARSGSNRVPESCYGIKELIILEVGPGAGLGAMVRQNADFGREQMGRVLPSLPGAWDRATDREHVAGVLGRLWLQGAEVDWEAYYAGEARQVVDLPMPPFESQPTWAEPQPPAMQEIGGLPCADSR